MIGPRHLVVFVKAPRLGTVKTRLAADVGVVEAWRFYRQSTAAILGRVGRDPRWTCGLAVTPDSNAGHWPGDLPRRPQGTGDLGARMARVLREMPPGPVIIIGTDIPDLTAGHVEDAFRALADKDMVFGPSPDGGFWLIGARRRPPPRDLFRAVRWSSEHALADTLTNLSPRLKLGFLDSLDDIDDGADYQRWRANNN
jgi:hypothetical protein